MRIGGAGAEDGPVPVCDLTIVAMVDSGGCNFGLTMAGRMIDKISEFYCSSPVIARKSLENG